MLSASWRIAFRKTTGLKVKEPIEKTTKEFLEKIGFADIKIKVTKKEGLYKISLQTNEEEQGALIGYHGETISALQLLLSIIIYKKEGKWTKILVDVGDYRKQRQEQLKELALKAAQRVKFSGRPVSLSGLSSFERRAVHMVLKDDPAVESFSEGEGKWRMLVVTPKVEGEAEQNNQINTNDK